MSTRFYRDSGLAIIAIAWIAGCQHVDPRKPTVIISDSSIPDKGIYSVEDVIVKSRGGDDYELAAGANFHYRPDEIAVRLWCRANLLVKEKHYDGWYPQTSQFLQYANGKRTGDSLITLFHGAFPAGVSHISIKKDWCAEFP